MTPPDPRHPFRSPEPAIKRAIRVGARPTAPPGKKAAKKAQPPAFVPPVDEVEATPEEISSRFRGENPDYQRTSEELLFTAMQIDPRYQRGENPGEVRHIAENFRPAALGTPVISARVDADTDEITFWVLDGQQRRAGAILAGYNEPVRCDVHWNLTLAEEAQLFLDLNYRRDITAAGKFKSALVALEPEALQIKKILDDLGITLNDPRGFTAVAAARSVVKRKNGFEQFRWALETLQRAFDNGAGGCYDGRLVVGLATFYRHNEGRFKQHDLESKLRKGGMDHEDLLNAAQALRKVHGVSSMQIGTAVANAVVRAYNYKLSKTKLPMIGLASEPEYADDYEDVTED